MNSDRDSPDNFAWMHLSGLAYRYFTDKEAFFFGLDYQSWTQNWKKDNSSITGTSLILGIKGSF